MKIITTIAILALLVFATIGVVNNSMKGPELPRLGEVHNFSLTDSNSEDFAFSSLDGHPKVVSFFFTSCMGTCPLITAKIKQLQTTYANKGLRFLSISVDPRRDKPRAIHRFAKKHEADLSSWHFLTGPKSTIDNILLTEFKVATTDEPAMHTNRVVLLDKQNQIRGYYNPLEQDEFKNLKQSLEQVID